MVSRLRHALRSIALAAGLGAVAVVAPLGSAGCFTNACDGDFKVFSAGQLADEGTWQTSPIAGAWLPFPARRTYWLDTTPLGRFPREVLVWVSTMERPNEGTGSFTQASGNLALVAGVTDRGLLVTNDSCAEMFVRVVVKASPLPADAGAPVVDASVVDASVAPVAPDAAPPADAAPNADASSAPSEDGGL
jgi:hypothetical protein